MSLTVLINLFIIAAGVLVLFQLGRTGMGLSRRVLIALVAGAAVGVVFQALYAADPETISGTLAWSNVIGGGYINLLRMIVMPLILVSMTAAVVRMDEAATLGKIGGLVVGLLILTTMIAALVGIIVANVFGLTADGLTEGAREMATAEILSERQATLADMTLAEMLLSFIPQNIFSDLTGARPTSIIAVVVFGILLGIAGLHLTRDDAARGEAFRSFVETAQAVVLKLVRMVIALTPYGVFALMLRVSATSSAEDILNLLSFVVASYLAIAIMFVVHALIIAGSGTSPATYFKKTWPVLAFAFTSRSSAATIPLNVETQTRELDVAVPIANLSASFGATIGQNGCAGIYPAMLAVMIAPSMGVNPMDPTFVATLIGIVAISSFGVAGIGGGATLAALIVLPALGFPVALVALLISIEPLIDMARTALNVSGSMTAGIVTNRVLGMREGRAPDETTGAGY
ncbi:MAG: cation:dicarboxylase symporter family transporter, partial [Gammaproteobacteria bacterium]|nr:cation:dicarboxylase symporter family transporter [Gammaproteobacteria bacterium]